MINMELCMDKNIKNEARMGQLQNKKFELVLNIKKETKKLEEYQERRHNFSKMSDDSISSSEKNSPKRKYLFINTNVHNSDLYLENVLNLESETLKLLYPKMYSLLWH